MLQALAKALLLIGRQVPESGIILQRVFLLDWRHVLIATEPVSGVSAGLLAHLRLTIRLGTIRWRGMTLLRRMIGGGWMRLCERTKTSFLAKAGKWQSGR
jgi:hypothetical protein